jgi:hypothetical protein
VADPDKKPQAKDELARELERLARGKVPSSDDTDHLSVDPILSDEQMGKPQRPKSPTNQPHATPSTSRPPTSRPARSASSQARPDRPATPFIRPETPEGSSEPVTGEFIFAPEPLPIADDDDAVEVPAPTPDVFTRPKTTTYPARRDMAPTAQSIWGRRTVVPILITNGVMLPTLGGLWFLTDEDSPFRIPGIALPIALIAVGIILLALGLANAMALRHLLRTTPKA